MTDMSTLMVYLHKHQFHCRNIFHNTLKIAIYSTQLTLPFFSEEEISGPLKKQFQKTFLGIPFHDNFEGMTIVFYCVTCNIKHRFCN